MDRYVTFGLRSTVDTNSEDNTKLDKICKKLIKKKI